MQWVAGVAVAVAVWVVFGFDAVAGPRQGVFNQPVHILNVPLATLRTQVVAQQTTDTQNSFRYEAEGRRDPFESLVKETPPVVEPGPVIEPSRPRGPLERFDLSSLTLSGIIWGELGRRAIIRAPDGKGYFITVGMYMGQNGGQIVSIEDDRIVIKEKHRDVQGNIFDKTLTIPLRRKDKQQG